MTLEVTDNGDGTLSGDVTDNGDGTLTSSDPSLSATNGLITYSGTPTLVRDIQVTASPIFTGWQVMGVTGYPLATGKVNNDNGYSAGATSVGAWAAGPLINQWSAGPVWIQE